MTEIIVWADPEGELDICESDFDGMNEIGTSGVMEPFIDSSNDNRGGIIMSEVALPGKAGSPAKNGS